MEFLDETIFAFIRRNNTKLSLSKRKSLISQICRGLRYLHEKEMLYRDISLSNVFVKHYEDVDVVKIGDFGLVKIPESNLKKIIHKLIKYEGTYSTTRSCSTLFFVFNNAVMISFLCSSVKRAVRVDTLTA